MKINTDFLMKNFRSKLARNRKYIFEHAVLTKQLRLVNDKLLVSESVKTNFLSNIRNEINNPISAVLELSKTLLNPKMTEEDRIKFSKLIHNEVFYLDFQLRNIINSAELEAGETKISVSKVNINSVVNNVLNSFQHLIEKRGIIVHQFFDVDEHLFKTDPEKLHLVLSNLISNALRFCNEEGNVTIRTSFKPGCNLEIRVENTGSSINANNKNFLFDRFRQMEEGTNKSFMGHGLGLSITKAIVDLMEGEIKLNASLKDKTEFIVSLKELDLQTDSEIQSETGNDFIFDDVNDLTF